VQEKTKHFTRNRNHYQQGNHSCVTAVEKPLAVRYAFDDFVWANCSTPKDYQPHRFRPRLANEIKTTR
jgi:hypothetical protein